MNDFLTVEPAPELASAFAVWCLGRDAGVQTVSAGGFLVPLNWYPDIPAELLSGAHVDGFALDQVSPQPMAEKPVEELTEALEAEDVHVPPTDETKTAARKTAARPRKPRARKVSQE